MADYLPAYEQMIRNEGGYRLHTTPGDRGGQTYAGIARRRWPDWPGWTAIDLGEIPESEQVRAFYRTHFWDAIRCDEIRSDAIAGTLFDFAVNAGVRTAVKLAQIVVGVTPDGVLGPKTLAAINRVELDWFLPRFALAKISRYAEIARRDETQRKFLLGWITRSLRGTAA